jgi:PAS domain S-box-containing protein
MVERNSDAKYQTLFESSMDAILLTAGDGKILEANPAACEIFQLTREEILNAVRADLVDTTDPRLTHFLTERIRHGRATSEITCKRKNGVRFPAIINSVLFTDAQGQERTSMTIRDISDAKTAKESLITTTEALQKALNDLKKVLDSSLDMICSMDEEGRFVHVSAAAECMLGYKLEDLRGRKFIDFVFQEDVPMTLKAYTEIKNGSLFSVFENRYVRKDGSILPIIWSAKWDEKDKLLYGIAKDNTENKNLEKAFMVERQRFLNLYAQSPSCMGIFKGPEHVFEMANPLYLKLIGKTDIIGKTLKEVLPEVEAQGIFEFLDEVYNTGNTFSANEMHFRLDVNGNGELVDRYLNLIYQAHRNNENEIDGILFFIIDVTEQVLSRKKIEASEKLYRQIVETAQEGIWLVDENNITTFVNTKMCEILEYASDEIIGKEIFLFMDDEGKEIAANSMRKKKAGYAVQYHFKLISKSGREIWTNISANPVFNENGTYKGSLAMITDITESKKIEQSLAYKNESLRKAEAISQVGSWEMDLGDMSKMIWSDEIYHILGVEKEEVTPSTGAYFSFIHHDDLKGILEIIKAAKQSLQNSNCECRLILKDGVLRYVYHEWQFEFDKSNSPIRLFGIIQDITGRKLAEIERTKMINDLIQRNNDLEQFTYIISHNLRAPVANILGIESLMNDPGSSIQDNEFLRKALRTSVDGLDTVVNDLTQILKVKVETNDNKEYVHFSELVKQIKISVKNLIEREHIKIESDFTEIDELLAYKSYLYSIFYNLISNSIKYRQQQVPCVIKIKSRVSNKKFELIFADNGLGIDLNKLGNQVFGLYKRFHLNIEGKGMGLFMVKKQVEMLGGKISIKSAVNVGTEFMIEFEL